VVVQRSLDPRSDRFDRLSTGGMRLSLRSYPEREDTHIHSFHQAVLPLDGVMDIKLGDKVGSISGRLGVIIASGTQHVFHASRANRFIVLDILSGSALPIVPSFPFFGFDDNLVQLAHYTGQELISGDLGRNGKFHLAGLLAEKIRQYSSASSQPSSLLEQALAVMRKRYAEPLTAVELANVLDIGASRLYEIFRRETARTPGELLAEIRLDRAEELLAGTSLPIAEIALMVGFSEQSALTRALRRRRGTTPGAIRRHAPVYGGAPED
jgi:AraC-like DNA-binding protein